MTGQGRGVSSDCTCWTAPITDTDEAVAACPVHRKGRTTSSRLPSGEWRCVVDGRTEPCGECVGCREVQSINAGRTPSFPHRRFGEPCVECRVAAEGRTLSSPTTSEGTAVSTRRLARITVDVLLPTHYTAVDLADLLVEEVRVSDNGDREDLRDFVQTSVVEARVVMVDADK